jgi:uncharacterized membrane protein
MKSNLSKLTTLDGVILGVGVVLIYYTLNKLFPEKKDL